MLCELGDAAVTDGDFHVGVNFAAVMRAPVVFVVRTEAESGFVAERAEGYGIRAMHIDSLDADAVRRKVAAALNYARAGEGPTLIEAKVQRKDHDLSHIAPAHEEAIESAIAVAERARNAARG